MQIEIATLETETKSLTVQLIKWSQIKDAWRVRFQNGIEQWVPEKLIKKDSIRTVEDLNSIWPK